MGAGIAQVAAQAGHSVVVFDRDDDALNRGRASIEKGVAALLKRGKIDAAEAAAMPARIVWTTSSYELKPAALVIEAIIEDPGVKADLFATLEGILSEGTVIATNTSSLSVTMLAATLKKPAQFLGLHFFNPAPIMKLVEIVSGAVTDKDIANAAYDLMTSWGKKAVHAKDVPGFIVNRVARPYYAEGWRAYEEQAASAATIDFLYRELAGFRMGPLELGDLIGHDINSAAAKSVYHAYYGRTRFTPSLAQDMLVQSGRLGRKSGAGVYSYADNAPSPAPIFADADDETVLSAELDGETIDLMTLIKSGDLSLERLAASPVNDGVVVNGVCFAFSDGKTAREHARSLGMPVVLFDWLADLSKTDVMAFAASCDSAAAIAAPFLKLLGKRSVRIKDRPGLIVLRTLAQLANCATDAVRDCVADGASIDVAMRAGVNYPFGPIEWAKQFGPDKLVDTLTNIADTTGEAIYWPNEVMKNLD
ncbi:3-hydroxyadipyl-CoA dehydrogenase [Durusdinium trenchii]|uniref:3-hydroxyadipyl-CoA dehydrogenase n=1 Tax=Durusdinium trenchii TaxID=1381693 RepID=A0ABP0LJW1_9DINO